MRRDDHPQQGPRHDQLSRRAPLRRRAAPLALALSLLLAPALAAQGGGGSASRVPPGEPARFLKRHIGLTDAQLEAVGRGEVVTRVLETRDKREVAVFGIVAVRAPRAYVLSTLRDTRSLLRAPGRSAYGVFAATATPADVRDFVVDRSDLEALRKCKPGDCDLKLPATSMEAFRAAIDWSAPSAAVEAQAAELVRRQMAAYVNAYRKSGSAAMVEYGDQQAPVRAADAFASLLSSSPFVYEYVPALHRYLKEYPAATLANVSDVIYWSVDKLPSLRPVVSLTHLSTYTPADGPLTLLSAKQLYASHYFEAAFDLTTILDHPEAPKSVYYMVLRRMRFDNLPSGGVLNIRGRVIGRTSDAMRDDLRQRQAALERGFAGGGA